MTALPCPFCSDPRPPEHICEPMQFEVATLHHYECVCCGAEGPCSHSAAGALKLWNARYLGDNSAQWRVDFREETK